LIERDRRMVIKVGNVRLGKSVSIFAAFLMFCVIYHPPILGINVLYLITPIIWLYILVHFRSILAPFDRYNVRKMIIWILLLVVYQSLISIFNGYSIIAASVGMIWWLLAIIPSSLVINHYICTKGFGEETFNHSLLFAALLQVLFALLAYMFPSIRDFFMRNVDYSGISYMFVYRMYGFARYLTGFTAFAQGTIAAYFFWLGINKNRKYFWAVPFILFSAVINARTSLVIFIGAVLVMFFTSKIRLRNKLIFEGIILVTIIVGQYILDYLRTTNTNQTVGFVIEFFDVVGAFFRGDTTGYFIYATNTTKYTLPTGIHFIFGIGKNIFTRSSDISFTSDIGFVNDIWVGGIVFDVLFYSFWVWLCLLINRKLKEENVNNSSLALAGIIAVALLASNFKGIVNTDNDLVSFFFIVATYYMLRRDWYEGSSNSNYSCL